MNATKLVNNFFFSAFSYISFKDLDTKLQHERRLTKAISLKNMNEILIGNRYQSGWNGDLSIAIGYL